MFEKLIGDGFGGRDGVAAGTVLDWFGGRIGCDSEETIPVVQDQAGLNEHGFLLSWIVC